jgi:hypothetical protein
MPRFATPYMRLRFQSLSLRAVRPFGTALALAGLGGACALVVSACGSSASSAPLASTSSSTTTAATTTAASTTSTTTSSASLAAYQKCLKSHGVTLPGAGRGSGPPSGGTPTTGETGNPPAAGRPTVSAAQQKAFSACASLQPVGGAGGGAGFGGGQPNTDNPAFAKFQTCLKQHGVDTDAAASRTSSAFQKALAACRDLLPAGNGGANGAPGGTGAGGGADSSLFTKYQACLRQHGVQNGATGQSAAKVRTAIAACRSLLPNGGASGTSTASTTTTG